MAEMQTYGFNWMDFVTAIPAPLFVVTGYKPNSMPNACLQSWACFSGTEQNFYAILSNVNKRGHMYQSLKNTGECALNFPSAAVYDRCVQTIAHNQTETDEITASGLTVEKAVAVNAPRIQECFLTLECRYAWEHDLEEGGNQALVCLQVVHIGIDEAHMDAATHARYGEKGYLYNVHYPVNPETYAGTSRDSLAVLNILREGNSY
jgi:flavin reductase (DIM6/NTAB) family NADH-FMN oxidoreductase RutF